MSRFRLAVLCGAVMLSAMSDEIPQPLADEVLAKCGRHCCICRGFRPMRLQVHHIRQRKDGGDNEPDNLIAICLDCHTDVHTKAPFTRRFTEAEQKEHRRITYNLVAEGKLKADWIPVATGAAVPSNGKELREAYQSFFEAIHQQGALFERSIWLQKEVETTDRFFNQQMDKAKHIQNCPLPVADRIMADINAARTEYISALNAFNHFRSGEFAASQARVESAKVKVILLENDPFRLLAFKALPEAVAFSLDPKNVKFEDGRLWYQQMNALIEKFCEVYKP